MDEKFEKFYRQHAETIYRYLYLRAGSREEAEDLTGEVFLKALRAYSGNQERPWLFKIARNTLIDYWRRKRPLAFSQLEEDIEEYVDESVDITKDASIAGEHRSALEALQHLTPDQQEVIVLRFVEELPYERVAAIMGRREEAIRAITSRALKRLRQILV